ncbi:hypothetical protein Scep_001666 [Stephania cephalantha]|uniref:Uncharacterized protein n=1 Tax=Stephania cephalantha TaxID=152367 RepID=A0AAP0L9I3_9MAGN
MYSERNLGSRGFEKWQRRGEAKSKSKSDLEQKRRGGGGAVVSGDSRNGRDD